METFRRRKSHWGIVLIQPGRRWLFVMPWVTVATNKGLLDQFASESVQDTADSLLANIPWWGWAFTGFIIAGYLILEASYQIHERNREAAKVAELKSTAEIQRLRAELEELKQNSSSFSAGLIPCFPAIRIKVTNTSKVPINASARATAIMVIAPGIREGKSEPFMLLWEENRHQKLDINPGDHGTLFIAELIRQPEIHRWEAHSGPTPHIFTFTQHAATEEPRPILFVLDVYPSHGTLDGRPPQWHIQVQEEHSATNGFSVSVERAT